MLGELRFDFTFSFVVFQHIPSKAMIENYVRETARVLRPGGLFKFQLQGDPSAVGGHDDSRVWRHTLLTQGAPLEAVA